MLLTSITLDFYSNSDMTDEEADTLIDAVEAIDFGSILHQALIDYDLPPSLVRVEIDDSKE